MRCVLHHLCYTKKRIAAWRARLSVKYAINLNQKCRQQWWARCACTLVQRAPEIFFVCFVRAVVVIISETFSAMHEVHPRATHAHQRQHSHWLCDGQQVLWPLMKLHTHILCVWYDELLQRIAMANQRRPPPSRAFTYWLALWRVFLLRSHLWYLWHAASQHFCRVP